MERKTDFFNEVHLMGQVKHVNRNLDKGVASIELATYGQHVNFPTVLCLGNMFSKADEVKEGDWVKVVARVETRRKVVGNGEETKVDYRQGLILISLNKVKSLGEKFFGNDAGTDLYESENLVALTGTINSFKVVGDKNNRAQATLYCMNGRFRSLIMLTFFSNDAEALVKNFEKGDWVNVIGRVQTIPSTKSNTGRKKEVLIGRRISKIETANPELKEA